MGAEFTPQYININGSVYINEKDVQGEAKNFLRPQSVAGRSQFMGMSFSRFENITRRSRIISYGENGGAIKFPQKEIIKVKPGETKQINVSFKKSKRDARGNKVTIEYNVVGRIAGNAQ